MVKVCIVGAGIVGLSTAYRLKDELKENIELIVISEKFFNETTSYGSGGLWEPYQISGTPDELINYWGSYTFKYFQKIHYSSEAIEAGVQLMTCYVLSEEKCIDSPSWRDISYNFQKLSSNDLNNMGIPSKYSSGYSFGTYVVDQKYHLRYLYKKLQQMNVQFIQKKIDSLNELFESNISPDVIINCTGLGSFDVVQDNSMYPIRGQVLRVKAPWMKSVWFFGSSYIIPNIDNVVIGGTAQKNDWNTTVSLEDTDNILNGVSEIFPSMKDALVESVWVGLRPGRTPLRLDSSTIIVNNNEKILINCYGHGGSGVTLAMGCAQDILINHIKPFLSYHKEI